MNNSRLDRSRSSVFNPGPGSYNLPGFIKNQHSTSKQNQQKRFKPYETSVPGPGQYNTAEIDASSLGPKALILSRTNYQKIDPIPGPGSYQPDFNKVMRSQSGYHLSKGDRMSPSSKIKFLIPGPGSYETDKSTLLNERNAIGFGPQRKIIMSNLNNVPGPGKYNTLDSKIVLSNAPSSVFGKGERLKSYNTLVPGPGTHKISSEFDQNQKKGFSISSRNGSALLENKWTPGPGAYKTQENNKIKFRTTSFTVPKSSRLRMQNEKQILSIPGPQKYDIKISAMEHKSFKIGGSPRKGLEKLSNVPGPGAYSYKDLKEMPKFSVPKSNSSWIKPSFVPGPGNYDPKMIVNMQYQSIGVNKDDRKPLYDDKHTPGPGQYKIADPASLNGGYKLGNEKRADLNWRQKLPGPGQYNVRSILKGQLSNKLKK